MHGLLPVGAYVLVTEPFEGAQPPFYAKVVGYDLFKSKYEIGARYPGWGQWHFMTGGYWTFPLWCVQVTEAEATALPEVKP